MKKILLTTVAVAAFAQGASALEAGKILDAKKAIIRGAIINNAGSLYINIFLFFFKLIILD